MKKRAFIISGFNMNQNASDPKYSELRKIVSSKGYYVIPVPIMWNNKTVSEYTDLFVTFYEKNKSDEENIVIGNSFGAMVSFLAAPRIRPSLTLVCSLSAYFKEDMLKQKTSYMLRRFGKKRMADSHVISATKTADRINKLALSLVFMRGERENWGRYIALSERVEESAKAVKNSKLVIISNCPHSFRHSVYAQAIGQEI